jgi:hypothetical protein
MSRALKLGRPGVLFAFLVLAVGPAGLAFAAVARPTTSAVEVTVTFTDAKLVLSRSTLQAGPATFVIVNIGQKPHRLAITGPGLRDVQTPRLPSGKSARITVKLSMGSYMLGDLVASGKATARWLLVGPATEVSSSGQHSTGKTSTLAQDPNWWMTCD